MSRCCSQCGSNGHNSRTCGESSSAVSAAAVNGGGGGTGGVGSAGGEIMLFGVRVKVDPMRKSVSMNNLSQYVQPSNVNQNAVKNSSSNDSEKAADDGAGAVAVAGGYVSADDAVQHQSTGGRERKRGIPWTEEEHKLFLLGLQKVGKGDWRGISRNFVKTRTPTQVASHAQKYFLRKSNLNRRRRRSSLFDITTDSVSGPSMEDGNNHQDPTILQPTPIAPADASNVNGYAVSPFSMAVGPVLLPVQVHNPLENEAFHWGDQVQNGPTMLFHPVPVPIIPMATSSAAADINLNKRAEVEPWPLSLGLSLSSDHTQASSRQTAYQAMANFSNGDSIISVA